MRGLTAPDEELREQSGAVVGPKGKRPPPNRVSEDIEAKIRAYVLEHPTHGAQRVANALPFRT